MTRRERVGAALRFGFSAWLLLAGSAQAQRFNGDASIHDPANEPSAPRPQPVALIEASIDDVLLAPSGYAVAAARTSLAAGTGVGAAIDLRWLGFSGWVLVAQLTTLRRSSHDSGLSDTRLWQLAAGLDRRLPLGDLIELRLGARVGHNWLSFDDAEAGTTGLGVAVLMTLQLRIVQAVWLELLGGAWAQPLGGNSLTDITFPPTGFAGLGFCVRAP
jgi:hypothetical protein